VLLLLTVALSVMLSSCATSHPPEVFHNTDNSALIIKALDACSCEVIAPTAMTKSENFHALEHVKSLPQHQTAVVILENYCEPRLGPEFRDRTLAWFMGLRGLGYRRIVFLQGRGVSDPDGLITLASYD